MGETTPFEATILPPPVTFLFLTELGAFAGFFPFCFWVAEEGG